MFRLPGLTPATWKGATKCISGEEPPLPLPPPPPRDGLVFHIANITRPSLTQACWEKGQTRLRSSRDGFGLAVFSFFLTFAPLLRSVNVLGENTLRSERRQVFELLFHAWKSRSRSCTKHLLFFSFFAVLFPFFFILFFGMFSHSVFGWIITPFFFFLSKSVSTPGPSPVPRIPLLPSPPCKLPVNEWAGHLAPWRLQPWGLQTTSCCV